VKPTREQASNYGQTYFVTASTWQRRALFKNGKWAELFLATLHSYRGKGYLLHEYVLMSDHFHVLIAPAATIERAVQFIKGGFSYRAKRELGSSMEIWQRGFSDHRIRDGKDFEVDVDYIYRNPVGKGLANNAADYPYCSAFPGSEKDEVPQWLKPALNGDRDDTAEAVPFQGEVKLIGSGIRALQGNVGPIVSGAPPCQGEEERHQNEAGFLQNEVLVLAKQ
jgi:putative transposase